MPPTPAIARSGSRIASLVASAWIAATVGAIADLLVTADRLSVTLAILLPPLLLLCAWLSRGARRHWLRRGALLSGALLISLVLVEVFFRVVLLKPRVPHTEAEFHAAISSAWPHPVPAEKPPDTFRILGLADSFGRAGDARNYHYLLETDLRSRGCAAEMVNLSLGYAAPEDELETLRRLGGRFHPDLVLHGFFVGNDFVVERGPLMTCLGIPLRAAPLPDAFRPRNFVFARWLNRHLRVLEHERTREEEIRRQAPTGVYTREAFEDFGRRLMPFFRAAPPADERWHTVGVVIDAIRDEARRMGADYVMVIHPDRWQIEDDLRAEMAGRFSAASEAFDLELPQAFLRTHCEHSRLACLDLYGAFRDRGARGGLYIFRDTHYNDEGNHLAAERIADFLAERIPGETPSQGRGGSAEWAGPGGSNRPFPSTSTSTGLVNASARPRGATSP